MKESTKKKRDYPVLFSEFILKYIGSRFVDKVQTHHFRLRQVDREIFREKKKNRDVQACRNIAAAYACTLPKW
jgi:hypothetical protein